MIRLYLQKNIESISVITMAALLLSCNEATTEVDKTGRLVAGSSANASTCKSAMSGENKTKDPSSGQASFAFFGGAGGGQPIYHSARALIDLNSPKKYFLGRDITAARNEPPSYVAPITEVIAPHRNGGTTITKPNPANPYADWSDYYGTVGQIARDYCLPCHAAPGLQKFSNLQVFAQWASSSPNPRTTSGHQYSEAFRKDLMYRVSLALSGQDARPGYVFDNVRGNSQKIADTLLEDIRVYHGIWSLPFFDEAYYKQQNPDVPQNAALQHWKDHGMSEGRAPNARFKWSDYLRDNNLTSAAESERSVTGITNAAWAVKHYFKSGRARAEFGAPSVAHQLSSSEGIRCYQAVIITNTPIYSHENCSDPLSISAKTIPLQNYSSPVPFGGVAGNTSPSTGSSPSPVVIPPSLVPCPADRAPYFCDDKFAGYDDAPFFDAAFYLRQNNDVAQHPAFNTAATVVTHWRNYGITESIRWPNANFDPDFYLAANPDVMALAQSRVASIPLRVTAIRHYLEYGRNENRVTKAPVAAQPGSPPVDPQVAIREETVRSSFRATLGREANAEEIRHFSARLASGTQNTAQMMDELLNCPEGIAYYIRTLRTQLLNRQTSNEDIAYFNQRFFANPRRISREGIRLRILRTSWVVDAHRRHFNAAPTSEQETELVNIVESRDLQTDTAVNAYILSLVNVASAGTTVVSTTSGTSSEAASQPAPSPEDASAQPDGCE